MTKTHAIKTAAKWWADKLKRRQPHSNGDNSSHSRFACLLADLGTEPITDEQLALFAEELEREIGKYMDENPDRYTHIGCDYGPCRTLHEAAKKAGINALNFPYKTNMLIEQNGAVYTVQVSDGYARGYETVLPCELGCEEANHG